MNNPHLHNPLLPPNSTLLERNVSHINQRNTQLAVQIASISRLDDVPDGFLPFLAWQYSVDSWDNRWQPSLQRQLIKKAFRQHQIKGTITAIRQILEQFGYTAKFVEWWQTNPQGVAGTFTLELDLNGNELTEQTYHEVNRLVSDAKPVSRHLTNLMIYVQPVSFAYVGCSVHSGDTTTIYVN